VGAHPWVVKFLKAVFNLRPPVPRYRDTWDMSVLLSKLRNMTPVRKLSLKDLTLKTVTLVSIVLTARAQTIAKLDMKNMTLSKSKYAFTLGSSELKQSRPGYIPPVQNLNAYPINRGLCVYTAIAEYIKRTEKLRKTETKLFVAYTKPHAAVTSSTVSK